MDKENSSASNTSQDNNLNIEVEDESMSKILRNERDDIIKQKMTTNFSKNIIQRIIAAQDEAIKTVSELQSELELQNKHLKEAAEREIRTCLNLQNDVENLKKMTRIFSENLTQLKNTIEGVEVNTEQIGESKHTIFKKITEYLVEQKIMEKRCEEENQEKQKLIDIKTEKVNNRNEEKRLAINKANEEEVKLRKRELELKVVIENENGRVAQLQIELQKRRVDQENDQSEYAKLQTKFSEAEDKHNKNKITYESQKDSLETNITEDKVQIDYLQNKIESLKQDNEKIDEENSQVQSDLKNLESSQLEIEELLTNILSKKDELKANNAENREKINSQVISLQDKIKTSTNLNLKELNKKLQKQLEDKKKITRGLKEKLFVKNQEQEEIIKQIQATRKKNKENLLDYEQIINDYNSKINETQLKNKEKKEANEAMKKEIEAKEKAITILKLKLKNKTDDKNTKMQNKVSILKSVKEELKSSKNTLQSSPSELNGKSTTEKIKSIEKNYKEKTNKIEKECKQFLEKMDTMKKNDNDKHIKAKRPLEDSIKTMNLQMNEMKISKENSQNEIANQIKRILEMTNKIEEALNEIKVKKSQKTQSETTSKSPKLSTSTRKTRTTFATSTPKPILKKPAENPETLTQKTDKEKQILSQSENLYDAVVLIQQNIAPNFPKSKNTSGNQKLAETPVKFTQKTSQKSEKEKQTLSPIQSENLDDSSNDLFLLTQKIAPNLPKSKNTSLNQKSAESPEKFTQKTEKEKQTLSPFQSENLDDSSNDLFPLTQKIAPNFPKSKNTSVNKKSTEKPKNLDDLNENYPLSQKNVAPNFPKTKNISRTQKLETKKDFPVSTNKTKKPELKPKKVEISNTQIKKLPDPPKFQSLTSNFDEIKKSESKKEVSASQIKKWQNVSLWPTDNETSDDGFNKFKNKNIATSTQKTNLSPVLLQKKRVYDFLDSEATENENTENSAKDKTKVPICKQESKKFRAPLTQGTKKSSFWGSENDSDDSFIRKLEKSKAIQSTTKESSNSPPTINLDTSTSD